VESAAEEAGYSSSAAFVRAFQREFGETPARWRRRRSGGAVSRERRNRPNARTLAQMNKEAT
jgi:AraC-like DNA-binding protein